MHRRAFSLSVAALGAVYLWLALQLPLHTLNGPGAGFFPIVIGAALVVCGIVASLRPGGLVAGEVIRDGSRGKILTVFAGMMLFCLLLPRLGYIISGALIMLAALKQFNVSWKAAVAISVVSALATYGLFVTVLGLQLPRGSWLSL
ncbi:hypothetical protein ASC80_09755 [Afipia sp. Root123D2]|uniref:tripartite tricarboxylate transporter TctB family protein n=1 Tax=Afipia sp. Root123D2 TaxID=1736436 RepID=UPI0006F6B81A|nr:tripartite tricarboxylate transporter TctB family protein [Afipia sp. Root123D2]KQW20530.1 hypothetical protein ASC80_09755 [Afipia sp. Root123D2]